MTDQDSSAPADALLHRKAAAVLRDQRRWAEAEAELHVAARIAPDDPNVHAELGMTLTLAERLPEAEASYRRALDLCPGDTFSLANLGGVLMRMGRRKEAEALFRRVLDLEPDHPQALRNLGVILKDAGRLAEAKAHLLKATAQDTSLEAGIQAHLGLSPVVRSRADIEAQRASYASGLDAFAASPRTYAYGGERNNLPWFYLAYHGQDDGDLVRRTGEVLSAKVTIPPSPPLHGWRAPGLQKRRIRVAFCSEFLHEHTIGRLSRGLIRRLDRSRFEVVVLHGAYSAADAFRTALDKEADAAIALPRAPQGQRQVVAEVRPDVMFFPDIGMSAQTYFLAQARLAPVQAAGWGHPQSSGLSTIDYFVSSELIEPDDGASLYSERLIRLPRLPAYYDLPADPPALARSALRLPEDGVLYGCPQSLFKFHPDFDAVLAGIADRDPTGHIVVVEAPTPAWTEVLRERWAASHPVLLERVCFLPRLSHQGFMALLSHIDVLLDPLHFGSGNNLYEAMSLGTPIVTSPGRFMRGRVVSGAYRQMGIDQPPVAGTPTDYAELAVSLGRDPARRAALGAELRAKAAKELFGDVRAVRAFESFLTAAVEAAARGEILSTDWRAPAYEATNA